MGLKPMLSCKASILPAISLGPRDEFSLKANILTFKNLKATATKTVNVIKNKKETS